MQEKENDFFIQKNAILFKNLTRQIQTSK